MTAESHSAPASDSRKAEDALDTQLREILKDILSLSGERVAAFDDTTPLFGALPELDSMAVAGLLTEMEDRLHIIIEDDDVDGETFETFGSLLAFARMKTGR
ncbi:acyl carrier protein [Sphingobium sp. SCG-1]|uniref:acyl carrier protein n=1 Tax=Sphingobium sp. SCG-1 TaxID=2072936 RepID=UPI000CD69C3B|nr:phosphopantetheine-binding protein [Sphingobium sp. SCG-1]AUW58483.1 acyl carrier protein [Sphingobium sp. SCG-1]